MPRQKCGPLPKARCSFGCRVTSKASGSVNTASSRLADGYSSRSVSPAAISRPPRTVSRVAVRAMFLIGETQRSISSTAVGMRDGSAVRAARWSGCRNSCHIPPEMTCRVVSSPPMRMSSDSWRRESWSSRSPSTVAWVRALMRSSRGRARRSATTAAAYSLKPANASAARSSRAGSSPPVSARSMSSDQASSFWRSSGAKPRASPITMSGSCAARSVTKSHSPRSQTASMISSQIRSRWARRPATRRGVNPALTSFRRSLCSGSSMSIIIGMAGLSGRMPSPLQNSSGWREAYLTSA